MMHDLSTLYFRFPKTWSLLLVIDMMLHLIHRSTYFSHATTQPSYLWYVYDNHFHISLQQSSGLFECEVIVFFYIQVIDL